MVRLDPEVGPDGVLAWRQQDWSRRLLLGGGALVEIADNNPLVCADEAAVPNASGTLALIALGPVIRAGLVAEAPVLQFSFDDDFELCATSLRDWGLILEPVIAVEEIDLGSVRSVNAMVEIPTPSDWHTIDELFEESYGRSFYVRLNDGGDWDTKRVAGKPHAEYRLRMTPGDDLSLLTVQVMADINGKCGAAQAVHAFNVMCGFEESLGIDG